VASFTRAHQKDGAERPRLPRAVMDRRSRPGPEPTTREAVGNQWHYTLVVVQAGEEEEEEDTRKVQLYIWAHPSLRKEGIEDLKDHRQRIPKKLL